MNRSFISVIAGGFGTDGSSSGGDEEVGEHREISAEETAEMLKNSHSVIITPGYGMAVAQAQYPVAEITEKLRARGYQSTLWYSSGGRAPAGAYERPAGGSQSALRHRAGDG
ncbi:NAD(P)(+) transhydrogenase (Re/Si-specific) subunit beta [Klebsiella pneumoniae subsp. pneumoniae]|nr:NAD(P)(+) transhydrogenase (Re/Si-specific) subunit beta [Klebsiella pneumoniae subsp. pneumoniae]